MLKLPRRSDKRCKVDELVFDTHSKRGYVETMNFFLKGITCVH